jgi:hypothetical protein
MYLVVAFECVQTVRKLEKVSRADESHGVLFFIKMYRFIFSIHLLTFQSTR